MGVLSVEVVLPLRTKQHLLRVSVDIARFIVFLRHIMNLSEVLCNPRPRAQHVPGPLRSPRNTHNINTRWVKNSVNCRTEGLILLSPPQKTRPQG